jgi:hypothetical protein
MRRIFIIISFHILLLIPQFVLSQDFTWKAGYDFYADNREYFNVYGFPQTILNSRISLDLGFEIDSAQSVYAGGSYLIVHGGRNNEVSSTLTAYYDFHKPKFYAKFGSFPRERQYFPQLMYTDSLVYERPNIQGASGTYKTEHFYQSMFIDWMNQVDHGADEQFLVGFQGQFNIGNLYLKDYMYYVHHAKDVSDTTGKLIKDNMCAAAYIGYNISKHVTFLDSATVEVGGVYSSLRTRPAESMLSQGFHSRAYVKYEAFAVEASYYYGDETHIEFGDPLFRSGDYTRINFIFIPNVSHGAKSVFTSNTDEQVQFAFKYGMHYIAGDYDNSQQILVKIRLNK